MKGIINFGELGIFVDSEGLGLDYLPTNKKMKKYKSAELGDYFQWEGEVVTVATVINKEKVIGFKTEKTLKCPHCDKHIPEWHDVVESSPMFQDGATAIKSLTEK